MIQESCPTLRMAEEDKCRGLGRGCSSIFVTKDSDWLDLTGFTVPRGDGTSKLHQFAQVNISCFNKQVYQPYKKSFKHRLYVFNALMSPTIYSIDYVLKINHVLSITTSYVCLFYCVVHSRLLDINGP